MLWRFALFALAQEPAAPATDLRVFLDCQSVHCDFDHLRRTIGYVDWVRDRTVADVHVLGTARGAGAVGQEVTLIFVGLRRFAGRVDTLRFTTSNTDTEAERRDVLTRHLGLGLVPYAVRTPAGARLSVTWTGQEEAERAEAPAEDPWNFWVFQVTGGGSFDGESRQSQISLDGSLEASRVTASHKLGIEVSGEYQREEFELEPGEVFVADRRSWSAELVTVWSLGPHWSLGGIVDVQHSVFSNYDLALETGPAIEFSVFPYSQTSHRRISILYGAGAGLYRYRDTTIFGRIRETRPLHVLETQVNFQQRWGSLFGGVSGSQYLDDLSQHRIEVFGGIELRLVRGLFLDMFGEVARVKSQINLPAGGLTPEEILVRQRELGTEFEYRLNVGLSYTFGSIFNNVVNPRF